jgi:hypothetical protein
MGRGLSLVQKRILTRVLQEKFVTCQDLLTMWGVQPGDVVDKGTYAAAHSALSRSLTRLFLRNLIEYWQDKLSHYRTAITLTEAGRSMAESIILDEGVNG